MNNKKQLSLNLIGHNRENSTIVSASKPRLCFIMVG